MISKLNFVWYLIALGVSLIILRIKINVKKSHLFISIFIMVCCPILLSSLAYYNNPNANIINIIKDNFSTTVYGEKNYLFLKNVNVNLRRLNMIFSNDAYAYAKHLPIVREREFINQLYFPPFLLSILFYLICFILGKRKQY